VTSEAKDEREKLIEKSRLENEGDRKDRKKEIQQQAADSIQKTSNSTNSNLGSNSSKV